MCYHNLSCCLQQTSEQAGTRRADYHSNTPKLITRSFCPHFCYCAGARAHTCTLGDCLRYVNKNKKYYIGILDFNIYSCWQFFHETDVGSRYQDLINILLQEPRENVKSEQIIHFHAVKFLLK
jgi:hypothetical protein